jgi:HD-GYP domain-containing protein (c-di-GMP phosphodiesterase class II)
MALPWRRPSFTVTLIWVFLPRVCGTGLLVAWMESRHMAQLLTAASEDTLNAMVGDLRANWARVVDPRFVLMDLELLADAAGGQRHSNWRSQLPRFQQVLANTPVVMAYSVGRNDGSFLRVERLPQPQGIGLLVQGRIGAAQPFQQAFDARLQPIPGPPLSGALAGYDPRTRPWYQLGQRAGSTMVLSPVQKLALSGGLGLTLSRGLPAGDGAVAASIRLEDLEKRLNRFRLTPGAQLAVVDSRRRLLLAVGGPDAGEVDVPIAQGPSKPLAAMEPLLQRLQRSSDAANQAPELKAFRVGQQTWYGGVVGMGVSLRGAGTMLMVAVPERELLAEARRAMKESLLLTLLVVLLTVPVVVLVSHRLAAALRRLAAQAAAIRHFDFEPTEPVRSWVREVNELASTFEGMRETIRTFLQSSAALGAEPDVERLLQRLLADAISSSGASSGELLDPAVAAASDDVADPSRLRLPLRSRDGGLQGVLELRFAQPPEPARVAFCTALSGAAAVALETRSLIAAQKALFAAFIEIIAAAIDAKSPYTGGHCARVPELAAMLASAACQASSGTFADFQLSETDWEALHIGSWLHDCGKVTTPEYVVDKATKLETLYDRIHEIRMRFELLKADAETAYWRGLAEGGDAVELRRCLEAQWTELDADFAFVAACNRGGEAMAPEDLERLQQIAQRRWRRSLDDRLGISNDELRRCTGEAEQSLPCWEPLLADRPRHRIPRPEQQRLQADNPWGFTMAEPELLADRGELHNLSIQRGTLTEEERYAINQHIIQTIRMLDALPYPQHLQAVPEIAGGHHERMDGRGYPRSLSGEQMSPLARMMAIADVFEALTAVDRPYKSGKPLSASLAIMARMVQEQHLDADLFELFVRSGVYRRYAERFLAADQIDAVDEEALLRA